METDSCAVWLSQNETRTPIVASNFFFKASLALVLSDQGKDEQAEEMHRQALELRDVAHSRRVCICIGWKQLSYCSIVPRHNERLKYTMIV